MTRTLAKLSIFFAGIVMSMGSLSAENWGPFSGATSLFGTERCYTGSSSRPTLSFNLFSKSHCSSSSFEPELGGNICWETTWNTYAKGNHLKGYIGDVRFIWSDSTMAHQSIPFRIKTIKDVKSGKTVKGITYKLGMFGGPTNIQVGCFAGHAD